MDDWRLRVCLERTVELAPVRLSLRDWPGLGGPLVHVADPLATDDSFVDALATRLAQRYRVLSLKPRGESAYQVDAADLLATLDQFGFEAPILVGEHLGCVAALLVAAWHAGRVAGLVLVEPTYDLPASERVEARALKDCPPDWSALRRVLRCPLLEVQRGSSAVEQLEQFLAQLAPVVS